MDDEPVATGDAKGGAVSTDFRIVVDAHGGIVAWSAAVEGVLGYKAHELLRVSADNLFAAELPASARGHMSAGLPWTSQVVLRHRDGYRVAGHLQGTPLAHPTGESHWLLSGAAATYSAGPSDAAAARLWDMTLAQLPLPVAVYDSDARFVTCNQAMSIAMGMPPEEMRGLTVSEIQASHTEIDRLQRQVISTGEAIYREQEPSRATGEVRDHAWSIFMSPLKDGAGTVQGMSALVVDTTEQYWARRRLAVLNDAGVRIGSTLDVSKTAEELAEVAVGGFADFVTVDLLESVAQGDEPNPVSPAGPVVFHRAAQRSVLPGCPESVVPPGTADVYPLGSPPVRALVTGLGTRHGMGDPAVREWMAASPARAESMRRHGVHSLMLVPLRARGVTLGLVILLRHRTDDAFGRDDLLLAEEIAARAAVSIDNARRYTRERRTALALQRSLLPERLPALAAVDLAARYLPAGSGSEVGGDWFDVIPLSGARVALVVGDVVGHGIHASATMGRLRTAVRTLADVDLAPDELLTQLDDLVLRLDREEGPDVRQRVGEATGEVGATCLYAVYDPVTRRCQMARAGHPPPAVVDPDGTARFLDLPAGPPLGLGGLPFEAVDVELAEGSVLALYTDGLVEAAGRDIDVGLDLLREGLRDPADCLDDTCEHVMRQVKPAPAADDIVLLLARSHALDADRVRTWQLPSDPAGVARARRMAVEQVAAWGLDELAFATELIVSELVTNAIRYGHAPIQLRLIRANALICEVSDANSAAPHLRRARIFDEGGRGLLLVAQVAERWGSRQTATGKAIWAELPLPG
ncbi:SpoIIE family protein phosphatase [Streptomyces sp. HPF1205]|uniref:SpoIIE family protein phosphatase n=1 Tax=Streptomyces sp. HPF1205 TaxID=2873262 RepID=UPI001CED2382|nr:SpoIIE family protein phosphatase [Streptomyces sp. HPF1205]